MSLPQLSLLFLILMTGACNLPVAKFLVEQEKETAPSEVEFTNQSEKAEYYEWDFGDGNQSTEINPSHRYLRSGDYKVVLKAMAGKKIKKTEKMVKVDPPADKLVEIQTPLGNMMVRLYDATPQHRDNFLKLADEGYFDSLLFHRVIQGFMIQGGDPDSRNAPAGQRLGMGGPGYQVPAEFDPSLIHRKGALAAARTGGPSNPEKKSSGSQFYIVQGQPVSEEEIKLFERRKGIDYDPKAREVYQQSGGTPFLDMEYTVFGEVIEGLEVIDKIAAVATNPDDRPVEDVPMKIVVIR
jgi:peptidyl-prolyl cis-trans isomerase B (cyclophilin B)